MKTWYYVLSVDDKNTLITKNVILIEHRPTYKAMYGLNLTLYLGVKVFCAITFKDAIELINKNEIRFIFIDNSAYTQDIATKLAYTLDTLKKEIPIYVIGHTELNEEKFHIFDSGTAIKTILQTIAKKYNITARQMVNNEVDEHYAIPLEFIVPGWVCPKPIYQKKNEEYLEVLIPDTVVTENFVNEMELLDIEFLYVNSNERLQFVNSLTLQIAALLNDSNLSKEDRINLTATGHQIVMEQARSLAISDSTLHIANSCINSMHMLIMDVKDLKDLLENYLKNHQTFAYQHSFLSTYIGTHLIKKMPWSSKEQQEKYSFICFFHDISLKDDIYIKIHSEEELQELEAPKKDKLLIQNHALISAKIVSNFAKIPFGVDTIIKQHHGSKTGEGLNKLYKDLSPLAAIFILSEEWARVSLNSFQSEKSINKEKIIRNLYYKYNTQAFQKILPHLNDLEI